LSVRATTPLLAAAASHDDLVVGARTVKGSNADAPVFFGLPGGMRELVDALAARLPDLRTDAPVTALEPTDRGGRWRVVTPAVELEVDGVVLAVPAAAAADLLRPLAPEPAGLVAGIEYASVVLVTIALDPTAVVRTLDASGFVVTPSDPGLLTACSFATSKWAHLRTDGSVVLRLSAGRAGDERAADLDDDELMARLLDELDRYIGVRGAPLEARVNRWPRSFPQYAVGHLDRVANIEAAVAATAPGLTLAGAAYRGLGVPACIDQGRTAARATLESLAAARS
jgi:oxygen-dependent protoporphyrinogen oxidase